MQLRGIAVGSSSLSTEEPIISLRVGGVGGAVPIPVDLPDTPSVGEPGMYWPRVMLRFHARFPCQHRSPVSRSTARSCLSGCCRSVTTKAVPSASTGSVASPQVAVRQAMSGTSPGPVTARAAPVLPASAWNDDQFSSTGARPAGVSWGGGTGGTVVDGSDPPDGRREHPATPARPLAMAVSTVRLRCVMAWRFTSDRKHLVSVSSGSGPSESHPSAVTSRANPHSADGPWPSGVSGRRVLTVARKVWVPEARQLSR